MTIFYIFIFLFGLCIGSFLNVLIFRWGNDSPPLGGVRGDLKSTINGRSHCPECGHILSWKDLVPVLSFILLRGKCRYCKQSISYQYPAVELAVGVLFVSITFLISNFQFPISNEISNVQFQNFQTADAISLVYFLFIASCLIVIFVSDLKYFIIPDKIIFPAIGITVLFRIFEIWDFKIWDLIRNWKLEIGNWQTLGVYFLAALAASAFFFSIVLLTRGKGMGLGDVKLAFLMGLILGWPNILIALFIAFVSGAIFGLILILAGKAKMKSELPFGTFLAASTFLTMIFGQGILEFYIGFLG